MNNETAASIKESREFTRVVNKLANSDEQMINRIARILDEEKPKTKLIHGVEVPDISFRPIEGDKYYFPAPCTLEGVSGAVFFDGNSDYMFRRNNDLCHPYTEEGKQAAILHAKAMLGIAEKSIMHAKVNGSLFDRLSAERQELVDRITRVESFMHSKAFAALIPTRQGLLMVQLEAMRMYATTLERRIEIS